MSYWLFKSEPEGYSIEDLAAMPKQRDHWDGVRNYQARNLMRSMEVGDEGFFYHSNCKEPGIVGLVKVVREAYPDHTQFDPDSKYFDEKADPEKPRWYMVDVQLKRKLGRKITLAELKARDDLDGFRLLARGNRLSVLPVEEAHWRTILASE